VLRAILLTGHEPLYLSNPPATAPLGPACDSDHAEPWWPPHKIVGQHLATYLATHADLLIPVSGSATAR
jgi:hypothetical protein